jgi:hypothetical protein
MKPPYVVNLSINTGTSFTKTFPIVSDNGSELDLTNYTINSQLRKSSQSNSYINFISTAVSPFSSGIIKIELTPNSTNSLKSGRYLYDIIITNNNTGEKTRVREGFAIVSRSITRDS